MHLPTWYDPSKIDFKAPKRRVRSKAPAVPYEVKGVKTPPATTAVQMILTEHMVSGRIGLWERYPNGRFRVTLNNGNRVVFETRREVIAFIIGLAE